MNNLGLIGVNIHSQNLRLLEKLTIAPEERAERLLSIKKLTGLCYATDELLDAPGGSRCVPEDIPRHEHRGRLSLKQPFCCN